MLVEIAFNKYPKRTFGARVLRTEKETYRVRAKLRASRPRGTKLKLEKKIQNVITTKNKRERMYILVAKPFRYVRCDLKKKKGTITI